MWRSPHAWQAQESMAKFDEERERGKVELMQHALESRCVHISKTILAYNRVKSSYSYTHTYHSSPHPCLDMGREGGNAVCMNLGWCTSPIYI